MSHGSTGILVEDAGAEAFAAGIARAAALDFDAAHIREQALRFSLERFYEEMRGRIEAALAPRGGGGA